MAKAGRDDQLKEDIGERIHAVCEQLDIPNPLEFTIKIMAGEDPRPIGKNTLALVELLETIGENPPNKRQWKQVRRRVLDLVDRRPATLGMSTNAATRLLEYSFAKKRADVKLDHNVTTTKEKPAPLSAKEADILKKKFSLEY